jgi:hypothetical protein
MANHFPDAGSGVFHISALAYTASIHGGVPGLPAQLVPPSGSLSSGYVFDTGTTPAGDQSGVTGVSWDYSWFDQDQADAQFTALVDQLVASIAAAYGIPAAVMSSVMLLQRTWTLELNTQGNGAPYQLGLTSAGQGYTPQIIEQMPYVSLVTDADAARGIDGGEQVTAG